MLTIDFIGYFAECLPQNPQEGLQVLTADCEAFAYQSGKWVVQSLPCEFVFLNQNNCQAYWVEKKCCHKKKVAECLTLVSQSGVQYIYSKCIGCWIPVQGTPSAESATSVMSFSSGFNSSDPNSNGYALVTKDKPLYVGLSTSTNNETYPVAVLASVLGLETSVKYSIILDLSGAAWIDKPVTPNTFPTELDYTLYIERYNSISGSYGSKQVLVSTKITGIVPGKWLPSQQNEILPTNDFPINKQDIVFLEVSIPDNAGVYGTFTASLAVTQPSQNVNN